MLKFTKGGNPAREGGGDMDEKQASAVCAVVLSVTGNEDARQDGLFAAWRVLSSGGSMKMACRVARVAAEQHVAGRRLRACHERLAGLMGV